METDNKTAPARLPVRLPGLWTRTVVTFLVTKPITETVILGNWYKPLVGFLNFGGRSTNEKLLKMAVSLAKIISHPGRKGWHL